MCVKARESFSEVFVCFCLGRKLFGAWKFLGVRSFRPGVGQVVVQWHPRAVSSGRSSTFEVGVGIVAVNTQSGWLAFSCASSRVRVLGLLVMLLGTQVGSDSELLLMSSRE